MFIERPLWAVNDNVWNKPFSVYWHRPDIEKTLKLIRNDLTSLMTIVAFCHETN